MDKRPEIGLDSYDRLFPSQDNLPKGGFGNLIALPLQRKPRNDGNSVFIDNNLAPFEDQWTYLSAVGKTSLTDVEKLLNQFSNTDHMVGIKSVTTDEDKTDPWLEPPSRKKPEPKFTGPFPDHIELVLGNQIYISKVSLSPSLLIESFVLQRFIIRNFTGIRQCVFQFF